MQPYILEKALKKSTFEKSLEISTELFDTIQGDHLNLFSEKGWYKSTLKRALSQDEFDQDLLLKYAENPSFEVKILENHYGYIYIPGMGLVNASREEIDNNTQKIYDAIVALDNKHSIAGWIIDVRLNIGGDANTMLAGLYHLIGDHTAYITLDIHKNVHTLSYLRQGVLYQNNSIVTQAAVSQSPTPEIPVALITGIMTSSAGEIVVLGFRERKNTLVIGEESYGLTSTNDLFKLPYHTKAAITIGYSTDSKAKFSSSIIPDIEIVKDANFQDLTKDKNVIEAIKFIDSFKKSSN